MKNKLRHLAIAVGISTLFVPAASLAQGRRAEAYIPFEFHVREVKLPAGKYVVQPITTPGVLKIANANTGRSVMVLVSGGLRTADATPRLGFMRYGQEYFLRQIRLPERSEADTVRQTPREAELAKAAGPVIVASVRVVLQ